MGDQTMNSTQTSLATATLRKFLHLDNPSPDVIKATRQISEAFTARGNAFLAEGDYYLAMVDYGDALNHRFEQSLGEEYNQYNPAATENRHHALACLHWFFRSKANPDHPDPDMPFWARDAVRKAKIPHGYLVVADDESILTFCSLTDEGREAAVAFADELATDPYLRCKIDNLYLSENDEFDIIVFRNDGTNLEVIHRASARDEYGTLVRE